MSSLSAAGAPPERRGAGRRPLGHVVVAVIALALAALHAASAAVALSEVDWLAGHVDHAPSGVPDFSTCRPEWSLPSPDPTRPGQWTHAGPVALANALWWLDSRAETAAAPPPAVHDTHPLVTAYPYFGPRRDDHDPETVGPLIRDLATRSNTNGALHPGEVRGTAWDDLVLGAQDYIGARGLSEAYAVQARRAPSAEWLREVRGRDGAVVLLLGAWELAGEAWVRIGGHYVALAGLSADGMLGISDPLADRAAEGRAGRAVPASVALHSCRLAPRAHDDAGVASHDAYALDTGAGLPDDRPVLSGYFEAARAGEVVAFEGLNPDPALPVHAAVWSGGVPVMALDAALAIVPLDAPAAAPSATSTAVPPSPAPTKTLPPFATAPATSTPASPSPSPSPSPAPSPTPAPWEQPMPTFETRELRLYLPRAFR